MSVGRERCFRCTECCFQRILLQITVTQLEVEHRTHGITSFGREGACIEIDLTYQVSVDDANRSARRSLRAEMIDIRNLHSIEVETVFRRSTSTHTQVVSVP